MSDSIKRSVHIWFKRIFIILFNLYTWYWIYKLIFIEQLAFLEDDNWEKYYWWFLVTGSQYFFFKSNEDEVLFK